MMGWMAFRGVSEATASTATPKMEVRAAGVVLMVFTVVSAAARLD